ncbi:MAG: phosphoribosylpyrophosphate synthetase [Ignavibacteria bacterium]|nr:phosphoribosylpyrophosphate synthetase [Ignavibacteria bacterium]
MYKLMKTVTEITDTLREEGYIHDYSIKNDSICCEDSGEDSYFKPEELIIEKTERYEGDSDPSDNAIVYAITSIDGKKGVLVDSYGAYSDPKLAKVIGSIPLREQHNLQV